VFGAPGALVGIITSPDPSDAAKYGTTGAGVVLLNAGVVHRAGPHRLYVNLARKLARNGVHVLRFDHSGIGDSPRRRDDLPFGKSAVEETRGAIDLLEKEHGCSRFVVIGLCSGTLSAFRTACVDERITGLVLLTALLEDPADVDDAVVQQALDRRTARSYMKEKALHSGSWRRLLTGKVSPKKIARVLGRTLLGDTGALPTASPGTVELGRELAALLDRGVSLLFIYGEPTTVLEYFRMTLEPLVPELRKRGHLDVHVLKRSDHTFTLIHDQQTVLTTIDEWLRSKQLAPAPETSCT